MGWALRFGSIVASCSAVALAAAPVLAEDLPHKLRLEYVRGPGAESCPDEHDFRLLVKREYAGYDVFSPDAPTRFVVTFQRSKAGRLEAHMKATDDAAGALVWERTIPARSPCDGLTGEVAFVISFHFLPPPPAPPAPPEPAPAPAEPAPAPAPPPAPRVPAPPTPAPPAAPPPPSDRVRPTVALGGSLTLKTTAPIFSGSLTADAGLRLRNLSFLGEFRWSPPAMLATDSAGRERVSATQYVGALVPCYHGAALVCGLAEGLVVVPQALPPVLVRPTPQFGVAIGARLGKDVQPAGWPVAVRLTGDVAATLYNVDAASVGATPTWTSLGVALTGGVGITWTR